jgi:hypothetical protein
MKRQSHERKYLKRFFVINIDGGLKFVLLFNVIFYGNFLAAAMKGYVLIRIILIIISSLWWFSPVSTPHWPESHFVIMGGFYVNI